VDSVSSEVSSEVSSVSSVAVDDSLLRHLLDRAEITDRLADLALGLDLLDLDRYRRCFADVVEICNPHFAGHPQVRRVGGAEWAESVVSTQTRFATRVHVLSNPSIEIAGTAAAVVLTQQATFATGPEVGSPFYRVAGPLRLRLARTADWRVTRLEFEVRCVEGDPDLFEQAWARVR
jgi:hypothetical protein